MMGDLYLFLGWVARPVHMVGDGCMVHTYIYTYIAGFFIWSCAAMQSFPCSFPVRTPFPRQLHHLPIWFLLVYTWSTEITNAGRWTGFILTDYAMEPVTGCSSDDMLISLIWSLPCFWLKCCPHDGIAALCNVHLVLAESQGSKYSCHDFILDW